MPIKNLSRISHFPTIVKKHGKSMNFWFSVMKQLKDEKYPTQTKHLKEKYGFSQTHANALIMHARGSTSSKRFATPADYYKALAAKQAKTVKQIFTAIRKKYPKLDHVIA
jgi:hypothetical protein